MLEKGTVFWYTCYHKRSVGGALDCSDSFEFMYIDWSFTAVAEGTACSPVKRGRASPT